MRTSIRYLSLGLFFVLLSTDSHAQTKNEIEALIDQLVEVNAPGFGYCGTLYGSQFLPFAGTEQMLTGLIAQHGISKSPAMEKLVAAGATAVPILLQHLDDARETKIKPVTAIEWMQYGGEYDWNRRTELGPTLVEGNSHGLPSRPAPNQLCVGDLVFVALGQIVNRNYSAARYQPSGGVIINSPVKSRALRIQLARDWAAFSVEKHKALLASDITLPDRESRRTDAATRLAYYYPDDLETNALKIFSLDRYDVFRVNLWVKEVLFKEVDQRRQRELFDEYILREGPGARDGILHVLFSQVDRQDMIYKKIHSPEEKRLVLQPRDLLVQIFGCPESVKSKDEPYLTSISNSELARFIRVLNQDKSKSIDEAVHKIFQGVKDHDYLALACMERLIGKGFDKELLNYCERREKISEDEGKKLREMRVKLQSSLKASPKE